MSQSIHHGIKVNEITDGIRPIQDVSTAVIGIVATATTDAGTETTALDAAFPVGQPVLITDVNAAIDRAGKSGTLKPTLEAIADHTRPILIVVRVDDPGLDVDPEDPTLDDNVKAGVDILVTAESLLGVRPRILGAPGLDTQAVTTKLVSVAKKLRAMAYAKANGADIAAVKLYRGGFAARELMLLWPNTNSDFSGDLIARTLGQRARIDQQIGWHKTLSNMALDGVTGTAIPVFHDYHGVDTESALLNSDQITTLVRMNGWRLWGNRTCSDEPLFAFESAVRTAQVLQDEIAAGLVWAIDKPITRTLYRDVEETINARFRQLVSAGRLIGGSAWIDPDHNPASQLAQGKIIVDYDFTPCAPAESITLNQRITDRYYGDLALAA